MKLLINSVGYRLNVKEASLFFSTEDFSLANRLHVKWFKKNVEKSIVKKATVNSKSEERNQIDILTDKLPKDDYVYFSFFPTKNNLDSIEIDLAKNWTFQRDFITEFLINQFKDNGFIVDKYPKAVDLSVYLQTYKNKYKNWNTFESYNITIRKREIVIALASRTSLISKKTCVQSNIDTEKVYKVVEDNFIKGKNFSNKSPENLPCKASTEIKIEQNLFQTSPPKFSYKPYYEKVKNFYSEYLIGIPDEIEIFKSGFRELKPHEISKVPHDTHEMQFGSDHVNINVPNGMKRGGPFYVPKEKVRDLKLVFIYKDRKHANALYKHLKNGLRHFPGIERYIGIPMSTPETDISLKYDSRDTLKEEFKSHFQKHFPKKENNYTDYFVLGILPFSKLDDYENKDELYYFLKQELIVRGIASQFIYEKRLFESDFHFHLPNIAVAMLAKIGGIPWRLNIEHDKELFLGFGESRLDDERFIGNAVYFDSSGRIKKVDSKPYKKDSVEIKEQLKKSILTYLQEEGTNPENIIIHYYKSAGKEEHFQIQMALQELTLDIPYSIIEINETKAKDYICFDKEYNFGMPKSGTIVKLPHEHEYLIFNNNRYEERPVGKVKEEYPIKIKIYKTKDESFESNVPIERISGQIYALSRIYWKSIRQQALPVTTKYANMIAEFASHFDEGTIPKNVTSQKTAWFI